ncbi:cbb3-type cytochrome oxidase assembly protein CcoS [Aliikangiella marina]|uniref:Cbb3-type cytochrome oxidase assembly protein CcoS n=1 Tax=Aliikangiella marina TaxID=1712262 RepID=A0A545TJX5_9GAMM|nr:cbb3-type cytochrome oxidase assembly protein CcoS [Aliikangiella marina]TQV77530.1 cbb3-type cytochrome oxidase assembly protein CcoS [Aliikangiella marina]
MDVIYWLIPLSIAILMAAIAIFFWAVRSGQFQDLDSPAVDILFEDDQDSIPQPSKDKTKHKATKIK